ncbi:MAG: Bax inhibitor-1/YccA family protein [Candidatus Babeliaceae bacterium]|nr:Bax inhibitor-1/YccA family protein [Candidatus Babeliaceae bacterium]
MFTTHATFTQSVGRFMHKVYAWMFTGLGVTAVTSYFMLSYPALLMYLLSSKIIFYTLIGAQLGLVMYLSAFINSMSYRAATFAFLAYSLLVGITLSPIFLVYTMSSITLTCASTACMFGAMAIYGYYTDSDLTRLGNLLFMGLLGIIIAGFANWFFASSVLDFAISVLGVLLFTALTAYDVQKIKLLAYQIMYSDEDNHVEMSDKIALFGALQLYLDFINLFLHLLRLMGNKRK